MHVITCVAVLSVSPAEECMLYVNITADGSQRLWRKRFKGCDRRQARSSPILQNGIL